MGYGGCEWTVLIEYAVNSNGTGCATIQINDEEGNESIDVGFTSEELDTIGIIEVKNNDEEAEYTIYEANATTWEKVNEILDEFVTLLKTKKSRYEKMMNIETPEDKEFTI